MFNMLENFYCTLLKGIMAKSPNPRADCFVTQALVWSVSNFWSTYKVKHIHASHEAFYMARSIRMGLRQKTNLARMLLRSSAAVWNTRDSTYAMNAHIPGTSQTGAPILPWYKFTCRREKTRSGNSYYTCLYAVIIHVVRHVYVHAHQNVKHYL